jgi:hypothetical protein
MPYSDVQIPISEERIASPVLDLLAGIKRWHRMKEYISMTPRERIEWFDDVAGKLEFLPKDMLFELVVRAVCVLRAKDSINQG